MIEMVNIASPEPINMYFSESFGVPEALYTNNIPIKPKTSITTPIAVS